MSSMNKTNRPGTQEDLRNIEINGMRVLIEEKENNKDEVKVVDAGKVTNMPELNEYEIYYTEEKERD